MLRRYGEQSLQEEIQALMIEWQDEIRSSEKIFLRASTAGKRSFWGYEGAVIEKGDERVVTFPFPTRRPVSAMCECRPRHQLMCTHPQLAVDLVRTLSMLPRIDPGQDLSSLGRNHPGARRSVHRLASTENSTGTVAIPDAPTGQGKGDQTQALCRGRVSSGTS